MRSTQTILALGALFTSAIAVEVQVRHDSAAAAAAAAAQAESAISSLQSAALAPATGVSLDLSGIPTAVYAAISDPTAIESLIGNFATQAPAWYTSLTPAAQSYILAVGPKVLSIQTQIASLEAVAAGGGSTAAAGVHASGMSGGNVTTTAEGVVVETASVAMNGSTVLAGNVTTSLRFGNSTMSSTRLSSVTVSSSSGGLSTGTSARATSTRVAASSSSSQAGAAQQTAALAAGVLGAVGVLGLAVAL